MQVNPIFIFPQIFHNADENILNSEKYSKFEAILVLNISDKEY